MSSKRIAFLGPPGTFSEEAALRYDPKGQLLPFASVAAVAAAVDSGMAEEGVVAIENSIEGSVTDTLDILIHESRLSIRRELVLPVEHYLLVRPGMQAADVKVLLSHPQALGQCRRFVERCFPKAEIVAALSTAAAVEEMMARDNAAAIGTRRAAELYGAQILARAIQDRSDNLTRFVVLAESDHPPTGNDKTSLAFSFADDRPGLLVSALQEFSSRSINLTKVESRPTKERLGEYIFLLDLAGHRSEQSVAEALKAVAAQASLFRIFGSYPRYTADA
ncbi:MAG: prephenate dehydratase [Dehalococcoidia bacterium]